ncbi:MAG TPA: PAS domain S-box protein [Allocoleopsis sp.]
MSMKILVVEDDPAVAQTLQLLLTGYDYAVDVAPNSETGLQLAEAFDYDLILLDETLPELDSDNLCQILQAQRCRSPILLLTGPTEGHQKLTLQTLDGDNASNTGIDDCGIKPFVAEALIAQVQAVLQRLGYQLNPLYSSWLVLKATDRGIAPQLTELNAVKEELRITLEKLRTTEATLEQKNQELEIAHQIIEQAQQNLKTSCDELEKRFTERTAELITTNQALQQQEQQWQALFNHTLDAITIADDEGYYVDANPAACELFGVSREDLLRSRISNFTDPNLEVAPIWQQFLQQGSMKGECRLYRPDGTIQDTEFTAIANYIPGHHLSFLRDISERKRSEFDRKQAEAEIRKFVSLADHSSEFIGMCDMNFIPFYVNAAGKHMVGLANLEQYQTATVQDFFFPEDQEFIIHQFFPQVLREGKAEVEIRFRHFQTGEALWMIYSVVCIQDEQGEVIALATISRNISDRKRAELELQKSEEQFRVLYDISPVGIFRNDLQGTCTYANPKTLEITGLTLEENLGEGWGKNLHPDDRDWMYAAWSDFVEQTKLGYHSTYQVEHRYLYEDGFLRWVFAQAVPEYNAQGQLVGFIGCVIDISERKQLEMKLKALNLAKDDFLSTVSHELRTPLTSIKLTIELLELALNQHLSNLPALLEPSTEKKTEPATALISRVPRYLSILKAECRRELSLVNNLLELQHLELGEMAPIWGEINLLQWLPAIVSAYQEQAVSRTLTLRLQMPESLLSLVSDEERLTSIMRELLTNACKYTPPGGAVTVTAKCLDGQVQLSVSNTEKPIPADALPHLFDKFYRVPGGDRWKQGGTGLGLALVKQQVESLGGCIQVSSDAEKTVFTVEVPTNPRLEMKSS